MKLSGSLSTLLVVLPFAVLQVSAAPAAAAASAASAAAAPAASASVALDAAHRKAVTNPQTSLTLDPRVIGANLAQNGLGNGSEVGQVASLTSTNNFINFCLGKTITNGLQVQAGSCNPVPMGNIPAKVNQPSAKFQFPTNLANVAANTAFTVKMAIQGLQTGAFVNPNKNYFAAPQQLNGRGQIIGHSHVVIEQVKSLTDATPTNPSVFAFFQGLNAAAQGGVLTSVVSKGLPAGTYRLSSINTAANHQPVIGPVAQHGAFDDIVYFTVGAQAATDAAAVAAKSAGTPPTKGAAPAAAPAKGAAPAAAPAKGAAPAAAPAAAKGAASQAAGATAAAAKAAATPAATPAAKGANGRRSFMIARQ